MDASGSPHDARYARQVTFKKIGLAGQEKLLSSRVALVGAGALGASIAEQLVRSGVGTVTIVDRDVVEESNLGRQSLYTDEDARTRLPKAIALARHLTQFNRGVHIRPKVADVRADTLEEIIGEVDLVLDGTDNLATRYLLNDWCVRESIPWVYGGCVGATGLTAVVIPQVTPCLRCLFRELPPIGATATCETAGVIAPIATMVAALQTAEAIKILVRDLDAVRRGYLSIELWPFRMATVAADAVRAPDCPCCAERKFVFLEGGARERFITYCGRDAVQVVPQRRGPPSLDGLAARLATLGDVTSNGFSLTFRTGGHDITVFDDGRALVRGTRDPAIARAIYDRYIGS